MSEVNEVLYPSQFDTVQNLPSVVEVTESTGEEINAHRDAILVIERVLGRNPQIGRYTIDPNVATVGQRLDIIENGIAEGRFAFRNLNVNNVLVVTTDTFGLATIDIGGSVIDTRIAPVAIRGPLHIYNSGVTNNEVRSDVPFVITARKNVIQAPSLEGEPLLRITDTTANPRVSNKLALQIDGNVSITNGRLYADFAIDHSQLLGIDTTPRIGVNAIHVTRGNYHTHSRKHDPATGALLNEVDPNPIEDNKGLINHMDLLGIFTKTGQTDFSPVEGVPYHVTNGDDHDHKDGRGATIDHNSLLNIDPSFSNHVTNGDRHTHSPSAGDGAPIDHGSLLNIGFLSHADIDRAINIEFRNHLDLIDPVDASQIDPAKQGLGFHVEQGHVSDPNAHHTRYTDEEALNAQTQIASNTTVYEEGRNTNTRAHIQAIGSGTVSSSNAHGVSAADIGALEGFDPQGNLPDFTRQFLERAVADILNDPSFDVLRGSEDELVSGLWTFDNAGGTIIQDGPSGSTAVLDYAKVSRLNDVIIHIDNNGVLPFVTAGPYHTGGGIRNTPAGSIVSTNVQSAINELDTGKEPVLGPLNPVTHTELDTDAVWANNIKDGEVVLSKLAKPYSIVAYTFHTEQVPTSTVDTRRGVKVPNEGLGEIIGVSVSWRLNGGAPTQVNIDVLISNLGHGGAVSILGGPVNIASYTQESPTDVPLVGGPFIIDGTAFTPSSYSQIFCDFTEVGGGTEEVTVVVHCKMEHIA